jgi:hypothetical protein
MVGTIVPSLRGLCFFTLTHGQISKVKFAARDILVLLQGNNLVQLVGVFSI